MITIQPLNKQMHKVAETIVGRVECPGKRCNGKQIFVEVAKVDDPPDTAKIIPHKPPGGGKWCSYSDKCIGELN